MCFRALSNRETLLRNNEKNYSRNAKNTQNRCLVPYGHIQWAAISKLSDFFLPKKILRCGEKISWVIVHRQRGRRIDAGPHSWWRHEMETFSALLALCAGNSPVTGEFLAQRPVTWSYDVFFDLRLNKRSSKQSRCRWFETSSRSLWRQCNDTRTA